MQKADGCHKQYQAYLSVYVPSHRYFAQVLADACNQEYASTATFWPLYSLT